MRRVGELYGDQPSPGEVTGDCRRQVRRRHVAPRERGQGASRRGTGAVPARPELIITKTADCRYSRWTLRRARSATYLTAAEAGASAHRGDGWFSLSHKRFGVSYCKIWSNGQHGIAALRRYDQRRP